MFSDLLSVFADAIDFLFILIPIALPIILVWIAVKMYTDYTATAFEAKQEYILLEVTPPQEVTKTPAAMELFFTAIHWTGGETTWIKKYIQGSRRPFFSLEMASIGGVVHFFIYTRKGFKDLIESQLYAQYPGIEVKQVEDYAQKFVYDESKRDFFGMEFQLSEPDPYPIKTYVDYGLEGSIKEEEKIDPLTIVIETLASCGPGEQMWFQYIIKTHKKEDKDPNSWFKKTDNWVNTAKEEIKKIRQDSLTEVVKGDKKEQVSIQTEGQKKKIIALERSVSKLAYDVGFRTMYLAEKDAFVGTRIPAMLNASKQYNSADLNGFKYAHGIGFDYPWQDFMGIREKAHKKEMLQAYKDRAFFGKEIPGIFGGKMRKSFVLNTEELATIYHFPGQVASTPTLRRVESRKSTPPPNLPV